MPDQMQPSPIPPDDPRLKIAVFIDEWPEIVQLDRLQVGQPAAGKTDAQVIVAAEFEAARHRPAVRHPSARSAAAGNPEGTRS